MGCPDVRTGMLTARMDLDLILLVKLAAYEKFMDESEVIRLALKSKLKRIKSDWNEKMETWVSKSVARNIAARNGDTEAKARIEEELKAIEAELMPPRNREDGE